MANQTQLDKLYMDLALRIAQESHAVRTKVGAVLVKNDNIISFGWNGTPSGDDNCCEITNEDGTLTTKPEVLHAENNAFMKLIRSGSNVASHGSTLYVTLSPCFECAKDIKQAGVLRVVYHTPYRITSGIDFLTTRGVYVEQLYYKEDENDGCCCGC